MYGATHTSKVNKAGNACIKVIFRRVRLKVLPWNTKCVCGLIIQHAMGGILIISLSVTSMAAPHFSSLSPKGNDFREKSY
jgi:hypothetical protein